MDVILIAGEDHGEGSRGTSGDVEDAAEGSTSRGVPVSHEGGDLSAVWSRVSPVGSGGQESMVVVGSSQRDADAPVKATIEDSSRLFGERGRIVSDFCCASFSGLGRFQLLQRLLLVPLSAEELAGHACRAVSVNGRARKAL